MDADPSQQRDAEGMAVRCLIVDDNRDSLQVARDLLERDVIGDIGVAGTSAEALQMAEQLCPDVALIDVMLGFDLAHALAQTIATERPHPIMISTYPVMDLADVIAVSPAIGFLSKTSPSGNAIQALLTNADPCTLTSDHHQVVGQMWTHAHRGRPVLSPGHQIQRAPGWCRTVRYSRHGPMGI